MMAGYANNNGIRLDSENMAGFGARRFQWDMEAKRREQERAHSEHQEYERQCYERDRYERQERERLEYQRCRSDGQRDRSDLQPAQSHGHRSDSKQRHPYCIEQRQPSASSSSSSSSSLQRTGTPERSDAVASASSHQYSNRIAISQADSARHAARSDTMESGATDSTGGLAYDREPTWKEDRSEMGAHGHAEHSIYDGYSSRSISLDEPHRRNAEARKTIYEDDFEETEHADSVGTSSDWQRKGGASLTDESSDPKDAPFRITRATVTEPDLPKAKCADCGERLNFEELADHSCVPRGASSASLLKIQVPPALNDRSPRSAGSASPSLSLTPATPRSPFFDKYNHLIGDGAPLSPAFSTPTTPVDAETSGTAWPSRYSKADADETPKAHAVRMVGRQAPDAASLVKPSASFSAGSSLSVVRPEAPPIQRSVSDGSGEVAARRKMIEEQRAAKKRGLVAAKASNASLEQSELHSQAVKLASNDSKRTDPSPFQFRITKEKEVGHVKQDSSSSVSTSHSDLLAESRSITRKAMASRSRNGGGDDSDANMTPSTSYEQFTDTIPSADAQSHASQKKTEQISGSKGSKGGGEIDLAGIEEMMKVLTSSPEQVSRLLPSNGQSEPPSVQTTRAKGSGKTDRERVLELELERLRERERARQMQMLRLKEKKRKEREARRCCVCDCSLSSSRTPFIERDGKYLCARDWKELYLPKCRRCNLSVEKGAVKSSDGALKGVFHRSCFACAACDAPFTDGSFYVFNNQPYCSRHYHRLNGSLCRECETGIEGDCRQTDTGDKFHPHCFQCQHCSGRGDPCREPLEEYYLVGGQRLCERHADKVSRKLAKEGKERIDLRADKRKTMLRSLR